MLRLLPSVGSLDIANPQRDTSRNFLVRGINVDNARIGAWEPHDFIDLTGV